MTSTFRPPPEAVDRPQARRTDGGHVQDDQELALALHAIANAGQWIQNADAKAALLAAVLGTGVAGLASKTHALEAVWSLPEWKAAALTGLVASVIGALGMALAEVGRSQLPTLRPSGPHRFSFPWLAAASPEEVQRAVNRDHHRDAWEHARALAGIATAKYQHIRRAVQWTGAAAILFTVWHICATILDP
jgi:hypothetical protein